MGVKRDGDVNEGPNRWKRSGPLCAGTVNVHHVVDLKVSSESQLCH